MIVPPPKRPRSTEENVLPLINIVFLLLIFFMLAGVLAQNPPFRMKAPATTQTQDAEQMQRRILAVASDGRLAFAGDPIKPDELGDALADWPADKPLQVRADGRIKAASLTDLFSALRAAGIREIDLLTRHEQP